MTDSDADWQPVATAAELERAGKVVVVARGERILLMWLDGSPVAMTDTCIHKGRSLSEGVLLNGRLVCAGHQWAFDLDTGLCRVREKYQPVHPVRIVGDQVELDVSGIGPTSTVSSVAAPPASPATTSAPAMAPVNSASSP